jgi:hypothetical protein
MDFKEIFATVSSASACTSGQTLPKQTISLEKMMEAINKLNLPPIRNNPFEISPLPLKFPIEDLEPPLEPRLKLRESVPMSDEFRAEMNQWLLDIFGRQEKFEPHMGLLITQAMGFLPLCKYPESVMLHTGA